MSISNSSIKSGILALALSIAASNVYSMNITISRPIPKRATTAVAPIFVIDHSVRSSSELQSYPDVIIPERSPPVDPIRRECGGIINFLNSNQQKLFDVAKYNTFNCGFYMTLTASKRALSIVDDTNIVMYLNNYLVEALVPNRCLEGENIRLSYDGICTSVNLKLNDLQMIERISDVNSNECTSNVVWLFSYLLNQRKQTNDNVFITIKQGRSSLFADIFVTDMSSENCYEIAKEKYESILPDMHNINPLYFTISEKNCMFTLNWTFLSMFTDKEVKIVYDLIYSDIEKIVSCINNIHDNFKINFCSLDTFVELNSRCNKGSLKYSICNAIYELYNNCCCEFNEISLERNGNSYVISLK